MAPLFLWCPTSNLSGNPNGSTFRTDTRWNHYGQSHHPPYAGGYSRLLSGFLASTLAMTYSHSGARIQPLKCKVIVTPLLTTLRQSPSHSNKNKVLIMTPWSSSQLPPTSLYLLDITSYYYPYSCQFGHTGHDSASEPLHWLFPFSRRFSNIHMAHSFTSPLPIFTQTLLLNKVYSHCSI